MDRSMGAFIDEKTGHEMQQLASGRVVDVDDELKRLGIKHDAKDMESPERRGYRMHLANVGYHKDDDLIKAVVAQHCRKHNEGVEYMRQHRERMAAELAEVAAHSAKVAALSDSDAK